MTRKASSLYEFGNFRLNVEEQVLLNNGVPVPIAPKVLETLQILVQNRDHIVEKDELMKKLWPDVIVEEANLAVNISVLRRVLGEKQNKRSYIETVPRRGYRFVARVRELQDERVRRAIDSLAILPFFNASADPNMEYLSDGITESIINNLSQLPQLKVMARATVFRYKGMAIDFQEVGRALGVRAVMIGRVLQLGENLVISSELVDVEDGSQLWGDHYQRKSSDIFSVQEEIAHEVSEKLRLRLSSEEKQLLTKRFTEDAEAYELYLKGRYSWNKRTLEELKKGVQYFRQAISKDPQYSLAYVGEADCFIVLALFSGDHPRKIMPQARESAVRAIQLNPTLGEAYASLAQIKFLYDWNWVEAELDYQRAIQLSPTYPTALQWHGEFLISMGHFKEGLAELKKARNLDPLSLIINTNLGLSFYWAREYELAVEQLKKAIELEPNFFRAHIHLGMVYERMMMCEEALDELEKARRITENPMTLAALGLAYASFGKRVEAEGIIKQLLKLSQDQYVSSALFAVVHAGFEDHADQTLEWLEKAYQERDAMLAYTNVWPIFDAIRSDARFVDLQRRIGFAQGDWRQPFTHPTNGELSARQL